MSNNNSGPSWYGRDGGRYDSIWERDAANTRYEQNQKQIQELQESNRLAQERMYEERENSRRIAEATRQAELDRYQNELQMESLRQEHDKKMRYYKLCDDAGLNYDDIIIFENWLNNLTKSQIEEYLDVTKKVKEFVYTDEIQKLYEKNEKMKGQIERKNEKLKNDDEITVPGVTRFGMEVSGTKKEIVSYIEENKQVISSCKGTIFWISAIAVSIGLFTLFGELPGVAICSFAIGGFIDLLVWDKQLRMQEGMRLMKKAIEGKNDKNKKLSSEVSKLKKEQKLIEEKLDELLAQRSEELENNEDYIKLAPKYNEASSALNEGYRPNQDEFYDFRIKHYNKEMEILLKKLGLNLEKIDKEDIVKEGSVEDYENFIEDVLSRNEMITSI